MALLLITYTRTKNANGRKTHERKYDKSHRNPSTLLAIGLINLNKALDSTPVFLITVLDENLEQLPFRPF